MTHSKKSTLCCDPVYRERCCMQVKQQFPEGGPLLCCLECALTFAVLSRFLLIWLWTAKCVPGHCWVLAHRHCALRPSDCPLPSTDPNGILIVSVMRDCLSKVFGVKKLHLLPPLSHPRKMKELVCLLKLFILKQFRIYRNSSRTIPRTPVCPSPETTFRFHDLSQSCPL